MHSYALLAANPSLQDLALPTLYLITKGLSARNLHTQLVNQKAWMPACRSQATSSGVLNHYHWVEETDRLGHSDPKASLFSNYLRIRNEFPCLGPSLCPKDNL